MKCEKCKQPIKCKECDLERELGENTNECLQCLDWKMDDLRK